jgi:hypothetical protein
VLSTNIPTPTLTTIRAARRRRNSLTTSPRTSGTGTEESPVITATGINRARTAERRRAAHRVETLTSRDTCTPAWEQRFGLYSRISIRSQWPRCSELARTREGAKPALSPGFPRCAVVGAAAPWRGPGRFLGRARDHVEAAWSAPTQGHAGRNRHLSKGAIACRSAPGSVSAPMGM